MTLLVAPADLAALYAATPLLLTLDTVEDAAALALPGVALWLVSQEGAAMHLRQPGDASGAAGVPLPVPPAQVLGLVAPDAAAAAPLLGWWAAAGPELPPLVEARTAAAALPALARLALAALGAQAGTAAALHRALVVARQDAEETREAMVSLIRHASHGEPPPAPTQVLSLPPAADGHAVAAVAGRLAAGQMLGVALDGLAAVALHVNEVRAGPGAVLRVRLYGAESGRVFGAWRVPGAALAPGWLALDLPGPIGPVRETACLDIAAELEAGDTLALALDEGLTEPDRAVTLAGPEPEQDNPAPRALALRLWAAPFGRRFVLAPHWDAEAPGLSVVPAGVPVRLPAQMWRGAQFPLGQVEWVALGSETPRLLASFGAGRQVAITLPDVPVNGLDLLQAEVTVGRGDPAMLEAALWLQPAGTPLTTETDLSLEPAQARWSGWRRPGPDGGPLLLPLALPLEGPRRVTVVLVLRHAGTAPGQPLRVEYSDLMGFHGLRPPPAVAARRLLPPPPPLMPVRAIALPVVPPAGPAVAPLGASPDGMPGSLPGAATVRLQEHYTTPDGAYRHLDIWLEEVREGSLAWPRLRFKLALRGEGPVLEFRVRPDWPVMFSRWPGTQSDQYGPYLLVREADLAEGFLAGLTTERDRQMLAAVVRLLPDAVAQAAREAPEAAADAETWLRHARQLAAALAEPVA